MNTRELPENQSEYLVAMAVSDSFLYVSDGHYTFQLFKDGSIATWHRGAVDNGLATDQHGNLYVSTSLSGIKHLELMKKQVRPDYFKAMHDSLTRELGIWKLSSNGDVLDHWNAPAWPIALHNNDILYAVEPDSGGALFMISKGKAELRACRMGLVGSTTPRSVAISPVGHFFVNDHYGVVETDEQGKVLHRWCDPGPEYDPIDTPGNLSIDAQGHLYVVDYFKSRVLKFDLGTN